MYSLAVINTITKSNLEKKVFLGLQFNVSNFHRFHWDTTQELKPVIVKKENYLLVHSNVDA